jgi:hypothetical protein
VIHHGYEEVEEHDDGDGGIAPEHQHSPEPREALYALEFERLQVDQPERCPE